MRWNESDIIEEIRRIFPDRPDLTPCGIGDDCAQINLRDNSVLLTTDAAVEGVHFNLDWMTLADAAYRTMTANLSDIAAMGAFACAYSLALCLPPSISFTDIRSALLAMRACIRDHKMHGCHLIGGDVVRADKVMFSVTMLGNTPKWPIVRRSGANYGDDIIVLGKMGMSATGLEILSRQLTTREVPGLRRNELAEATNAFKRPQALTILGPSLASYSLVSSMMDMSDGLATDVQRLARMGNFAANINVDSLIPNKIQVHTANAVGADPVGWMICGGEDFGLLVTAPHDNLQQIRSLATQAGTEMRVVGSCARGTGVNYFKNGQKILINNQSFSHF